MTLWGGRFEAPLNADAWAFTTDDSDRRLIEVDILGSMAHAGMLGSTGIVSHEDAASMIEGLAVILDEARAGTFVFVAADEDVHTAVERRLGEIIGPTAGKLHTGRSRNDQVATDLRLYLREAVSGRVDQIGGLVSVLVDLAERTRNIVVPSYTHLQQAQSTTLANHLLAHAWALLRDRGRFIDSGRRMNRSPLGAGASAGSSLPLDRSRTSDALDFDGPMPNPLDAVGSRDFVAEHVFACGQTMVHLSRLAEEIVLWATAEFGWATLDDEVSTGSSALPHKRNPDIAELIRGRTATVIGDVTAILSLQKALPLTYNRDLQEDKRIVFHADDTLAGAIIGMTALLRGIHFHPPAPSAGVATLDLADALVARGVPFREAHGVVGRVVRSLEDRGRPLDRLTDDDLQEADARFEPGDARLLDPGGSAQRRRTDESVQDQIEEIRVLLNSPLD